jgi:hypothetical protein
MQEQITLRDAPAQADEKQLTEFFRQHTAALEKLAGDYWYTRKGTVSALEIERPVTFSGAMAGIFRVRYHVSFFFTCDDVTTRRAEYMDLTFTVDPDGGKLYVTGESEPERGPDEF